MTPPFNSKRRFAVSILGGVGLLLWLGSASLFAQVVDWPDTTNYDRELDQWQRWQNMREYDYYVGFVQLTGAAHNARDMNEKYFKDGLGMVYCILPNGRVYVIQENLSNGNRTPLYVSDFPSLAWYTLGLIYNAASGDPSTWDPPPAAPSVGSVSVDLSPVEDDLLLISDLLWGSIGALLGFVCVYALERYF